MQRAFRDWHRGLGHKDAGVGEAERTVSADTTWQHRSVWKLYSDFSSCCGQIPDDR